MDTSLHTTHLRNLLEEIARGNTSARNELIERIDARFTRLAKQMLAGFPRLQGLEQTDDVLQLARMRLLQAIGELQFDSLRTFFGLIAEMLRRTLLDLTRHHFGRAPRAQRFDLDPGSSELTDPRGRQMEFRIEIHELVEQLPAEEQELVNLLYYHGCTQEEAADLLGVQVRTLQRHWLRKNKTVEIARVLIG